MKQTLVVLAAAASLALPLSSAQAAPAFSDADLQSLNNAHTRIVRQAQRVCSVGPYTNVVRYNRTNGCVVGEVERHVRSVEDSNLLEFHQNLPTRYRYGSDRSFGQVKRYFQ